MSKASQDCSLIKIEWGNVEMAVAKNEALNMLVGLEQDLQAHKNQSAPSAYRFAGYDSTKPADERLVGISKTANVSMNRGGQLLQFLAGYYTAETDTSIKGRIAKAAALVYNVFAARPIFAHQTVYATDQPNIETNGHFTTDPSGALLFLGLMMIDKQKVIDNAEFINNSNQSPSYIRATQLPRQAAKAERALYFFNSEKINLPPLVTGKNYVWGKDIYSQKISESGVNGPVLTVAALSLYSKLYNISVYNKAYTDAHAALRNVGIHFSTTHDTNGNLLNPTYAGQFPGSKMCLPIGHYKHARGAFPSISYNTFVAIALKLQAFAETCTTSSTFSNIASLTSTHPLHTDALKLLNYYRDRLSADGYVYEIGAHRHAAGDAGRFKSAWRDVLINVHGVSPASADKQFTASRGFDELLITENNPGMAGYSYPLTWVMHNHSFFTQLSSKYSASSGRQLPHINHSGAGSGSSVIKAFAMSAEAVSVRAAAGLGVGMMLGMTSID